MNRTTVRLAAALTAVAALSLTALSDSATAATTGPSGSMVIQEDSTFLQNALQNGVVAVALPAASVAYNSSTGFSGTFPVTGGSGSLPQYYGNITVGGSLLLVDVFTGKTVVFNNLAFDVDDFVITGVPLGSSTPVNIFDPLGTVDNTVSNGTQTLTATDLRIDAAGAQYADTALNTKFFVAGQHTGSFAFTYTPAS
ncbi:hypothetical protein ACFYNO_37980 [Kitasatospora sp. NPDC006697]|uniref:hypothetical protein n=1 Tax=Kitasatospora sp. NPDC006697 TaxID=3364020 RepID=UPI003689E04E